MSSDQFTTDGRRKYLNAEELERFIAAAKAHVSWKISSRLPCQRLSDKMNELSNVRLIQLSLITIANDKLMYVSCREVTGGQDVGL
jgi:hypothetical protein